MRYAIPVKKGQDTILTQVVDIANPLPDWASTPEAFLAKMFPDFKGFVWVADDNVSGAVLQDDGSYENPSIPVPEPDPSQGRSLTWAEFLDVGMATDPVKTNLILSSMPVVAEYGHKYTDLAGIKFADALISEPPSRLYRLMQAAKTAKLIDDTFLTTFLETWCQLYPGVS